MHASFFSAPVISSAARAAHRRQASSHICFGPVAPVKSPLSALFVPFRIEGRAAGLQQFPVMHPRVRAPKAQERLARNKCGSWLAGDAPRGRRSISQAMNNPRHAPVCPPSIPRHAPRSHLAAPACCLICLCPICLGPLFCVILGRPIARSSPCVHCSPLPWSCCSPPVAMANRCLRRTHACPTGALPGAGG